MTWRSGRHNDHTIYVQEGAEPSRQDPYVGSLLTPELSRQAVAAVNAAEKLRRIHTREERIFGYPKCMDCTDYSGDPMPWPCPTIQLLEGT